MGMRLLQVKNGNETTSGLRMGMRLLQVKNGNEVTLPTDQSHESLLHGCVFCSDVACHADVVSVSRLRGAAGPLWEAGARQVFHLCNQEREMDREEAG